MRDVQREMIHACRSAGDWDGMRANAEFLLSFDPLDEHAMLAVVEALGLAGERTQALKRYTDFERRLREELEAEPGVELRNWARRARKSGIDAPDHTIVKRDAPGRVAETVALPSPTPVYGRQAEFNGLWRAWEAAKVGRGSFHIITGVAGIGKTALATKLASQIHVSGGSVCFLRCYNNEKAVPFAPVSGLIRQLSRLPGFVATGELWIGELTRLVPELRERFPNAPAPMALDDSARHRLCDAALQAAESVADEHPLLVVVDDLHDSDEATLALVHYFGRQVGQQPILLVAIARSDSAQTEAQCLFFQSATTGGARLLPLGPLDDGSVNQIVKAILAQRSVEVPAWAIDRLAASSCGNPLRAQEAALAIRKRQDETEDSYLSALESQLRAPEDLDSSVAERMSQLVDPARRVAGVLAIARRPLSEYVLMSVARLPVSEFATALEELERARYIVRHRDTVEFTHERYAVSALGLISEQQHTPIHLALARVLASSALSNPAARYEVSLHLAAARRAKEARAQALDAARYAGSVGAIREETLALELALAMGPRFDPAIAVRLARCTLSLGDFDRTTLSCSMVQSTSGLSENISAESEYLRIAAGYHSGRCTVPDATNRLLSLFQRGTRFDSELDALILLLRMADRLGERRLSVDTARRIRRISRERGNAMVRAAALIATAYIGARYHRPRRSRALLESALSLSQQRSNWNLELYCRAALGAVLRQLGCYTDACRQWEAALALARRILSPHAEADCLMDLAVADLALGNYEQASAKLQQSLAIDQRHPGLPQRVFRYVNLGEARLALGQFHEAIESFTEAHELAANLGLWRMQIIAAGGLVVCAQRIGDTASARSNGALLRSCDLERRALLPDRWLIEAGLAWDDVLNHGRHQKAVEGVERAINDIEHRDVDHWLTLRLELVRLVEFTIGCRADNLREQLVASCRRYGARGIELAAL
jgi:predicted ATPase